MLPSIPVVIVQVYITPPSSASSFPRVICAFYFWTPFPFDLLDAFRSWELLTPFLFSCLQRDATSSTNKMWVITAVWWVTYNMRWVTSVFNSIVRFLMPAQVRRSWRRERVVSHAAFQWSTSNHWKSIHHMWDCVSIHFCTLLRSGRMTCLCKNFWPSSQRNLPTLKAKSSQWIAQIACQVFTLVCPARSFHPDHHTPTDFDVNQNRDVVHFVSLVLPALGFQVKPWWSMPCVLRKIFCRCKICYMK